MEIIQTPAFELIENYYYDYAKYINMGGRTVPFFKDTLKAVQRRILYASYLLTKNGSFIKSARIVGEVMGKYHPHGDSYGSIVTLVHSGLIEGRGNFGSNIGVDPIDAAASRYTEARLHPLIKKIAFEYIDHVPYFVNDLGIEEPEYIPTMLPLNLIQFSNASDFTTGIGVGLAFTLPMFSLKEAIKFLKKIVEEKKVSNKDLNIVYRSISEPMTDKLFKTGSDSISFDSKYTLEKDDKEICITEFSPGIKIKSVLSKLGVYIDKSKETTNVLIKLDRGKRASDYDLEKMLSSKQKFNMLFHDNTKIRSYSVYEIFMSCYNCYKEAVLVSLNKEQEKFISLISTYEKLQKMKPHLTPLNLQTAEKIMKAEGWDEKEVKRLLNYSVETVCKAHLLETETRNLLQNVQNKISDIDTFCLQHYDEL